MFNNAEQGHLVHNGNRGIQCILGSSVKRENMTFSLEFLDEITDKSPLSQRTET